MTPSTRQLSNMMQETAEFLYSRGISMAESSIILGSGLGKVEEILEVKVVIPYREIPNLPVSSAPGHEGVLKYGLIGERKVLMFCGRIHYYEGFEMWQVAYPVRILQALKVPELLITAAVGGLNQNLRPGDMVLVRDHVNLMPSNPLRGLTDDLLGERFPDLTNAYDSLMGKRLEKAATRYGLKLQSGIYVAVQGPSLETQAECAFMQRAGGDVVGMSVAPEVIAGVQAGIRVAALCVVSNMALHPDDFRPSTVPEILAVSAATGTSVSEIIKSSFSVG